MMERKSTYVLSAVISGHSNDIRCLAAVPSAHDAIVSGSRDKTARLWSSDRSLQWEQTLVFSGHNNYVSSVVVRKADQQYPNGLVYTGSNDGAIRVFDPTMAEPMAELPLHKANVSSLLLDPVSPETLLSVSWDTTAQVWRNHQPAYTLKGHTGAVWAGLFLPEMDIILTGSADKSIRIWKNDKEVSVLTGHTQAVRALLALSSKSFLSCGNDGLILMWTSYGNSSSGHHDIRLMRKFEETDFIYSICRLDSGWAVSGENIGIKVYDHGPEGDDDSNAAVLVDELAVPAMSVWSVCALSNGDIVAGCSDNRIYIFSKDPDRHADATVLSMFSSEVEQFIKMKLGCGSGLPKEIGGVKIEDIPGPEALNYAGKREGQTKLIKDGNIVSAYSWSSGNQEWVKVGDVVGDSEAEKSGSPGSGKVMYNGKEYDYVFRIDIDEGVVLKLPYNNCDDPYVVAQNFIFEHQLPQDYLDQVAQFIYKNSNASPSAQVGYAADPFTGGGAYVSGSGGVPTAQDFKTGRTQASGFVDPFTGQSAYTSQEARPSRNFCPQTEFTIFRQVPKEEAVVSKLMDLNEKQAPDSQLSATDIQRLPEMWKDQAFDVDSAKSLARLLSRVLAWNKDHIFPALDIARLAVLNEDLKKQLVGEDQNSVDAFLDRVQEFIMDKDQPSNQMLALRLICNLFSSEQSVSWVMSRKQVWLHHLKSLLPTDNKNVQIAAATLLLNISVALIRLSDLQELDDYLTVSSLFLSSVSDPEAKFRSLATVGTIVCAMGEQGTRRALSDLDIAEKVQEIESSAGSQKLKESASSLLSLFSKSKF